MTQPINMISPAYKLSDKKHNLSNKNYKFNSQKLESKATI